MAHQLRRIVGINLRNPKSDLPSGQIAVLDPRGGIVAAGENGVGKTTFLRLLPLFYGATPTQILRGTGHASLIRHTLPDASSAVAYEYERGSPEDLRCVVMHARPDLDAPQFHIIKGPFREDMFLEEDRTFVRREDFKARVEAMGYQVERRLHLHEWRSVILNEKVPTKEGAEMRRLAAVHSLGPDSLHGLDAIAASMANERLSFRDLQGIVIDRVTDAPADGSPRQTTRELKQSREAVTGWLEMRSHLLQLRERRPDAVLLRQRCDEVARLHHQLCALNAAAKQLQLDIAAGLHKNAEEERQQSQQWTLTREALGTQLLTLERERNDARGAFQTLDEAVDGVERRAKFFEELGVAALHEEQDRESDLQSQMQAEQKTYRQLSDLAQGIAQSHQAQVNAALEAYVADERRIGAARSDATTAAARHNERLRLAENDALAQLAAPPRLAELPAERGAASSALGALQFEAKRPGASQQTDDAIVAADDLLARAQAAQMDAASAADAARRASSEAAAQSVTSLARWEQHRAEVGAAEEALQEIHRQMTPARGTLLEFLRSSHESSWHPAAKAIDQALLHRTDLDPTPVLDLDPNDTHVVRVGPFTLDTTAVAMPVWVDMVDMQRQLEAAQGALKAAQEREQESKRVTAQMQQVAAERADLLTQAAAHAEMTRSACADAQSHLVGLRQQAKAERATRAQELETLIATQRGVLDAIDRESAQLNAQLDAARARLRADYDVQRRQVASEEGAAVQRLATETTSALQRRDMLIEQADVQQRRELTGAGVDPDHVARLKSTIEKIAERLAAISRNRHHVDAWREFKDGPRAELAAMRERRDHANETWTYAARKHQEADAQLQHAQQQFDDAAAQLRSARLDLENNQIELNGLLVAQGLGVYIGPVSSKLSREWTVRDLSEAVVRARTEIESKTDEVNNLRKSLRNLMMTVPGSVDDWVEKAEKGALESEYMLAHEAACDKALIICRWFEGDFAQPVTALHQELADYLNQAGSLVRQLEGFDRRVATFNTGLQKALEKIAHFERFRDLTVNIRSQVNKIEHLQVLREMQAQADSRVSLHRGGAWESAGRDFELPDEDVARLVRSFRDILQRDGGVRINLAEQVSLECSLVIDSKHVVIANEDEFRARASNGNTALIMAMFLLGFASMVRRGAPVRLTWVSDEIGRYDGKNLGAFLQTLDSNQIDVISAAPSADPAAVGLFRSQCLFENSGAIRTYRQRKEVSHAAS